MFRINSEMITAGSIAAAPYGVRLQRIGNHVVVMAGFRMIGNIRINADGKFEHSAYAATPYRKSKAIIDSICAAMRSVK